MLGGLPAFTNLWDRGIHIEVMYKHCSSQEEDVQHVFHLCPLAQHVWMSGYLGIHFNHDDNLFFHEWILYYIWLFIISDGKNGQRLSYFISLYGLFGLLEIIECSEIR